MLNVLLLAARTARVPRPDEFSVPTPPATPLPRAVVTAHFAVHNLMDDDNAMTRVKWAVDWMVRNGYLQDDRRKNLRWGGIPTQVIDRKGPSALTLTLEPETE